MKRLELIGLLFLLQIVLIDAAQGSSAFFQSTISLIGIGVFTVFVGVLLIYACRIDIKHWRKSIDGRVQLEYPNASLAEFQLPPMHNTPEKVSTPLEPEIKTESTQIEKTHEEKTLRIVTAMYTASNRDVPESVHQSLQSKRGNLARPQRTPVTLQTISEKANEQERSEKSTH
ncbi:hypothetical protein CRE_10059 [Caenorhabditis remanei]|uniref:Uncharacterized protein n=1 Tax=Caenorhabditis remanei TaxID=31234 RepID=E3M708_CAERE|nr:hypothetical protein CRE_10059 [Caenorhabditis remanei]